MEKGQQWYRALGLLHSSRPGREKVSLLLIDSLTASVSVDTTLFLRLH
jgi:hypothetical protein